MPGKQSNVTSSGEGANTLRQEVETEAEYYSPRALVPVKRREVRLTTKENEDYYRAAMIGVGLVIMLLGLLGPLL